MKKLVLIILVAFACNLMGIAYLIYHKIKFDGVVNVAVCLPRETIKGQMMLRGIKLYLSELADEHPALRKKIRLRVYDDKDDVKTAMALANQIGTDNTTMVVLGHNTNGAAYNAGKIYKRFGIIAITGSATGIEVTRENEWYFSVVPNDADQAAVMAAYIRSRGRNVTLLQSKSDENVYFSEKFKEVAREMGITITREWSFRSDAGLDRILRDIDGRESIPDFILLNTRKEDLLRILTALEHRTDLNLIGTSALTDSKVIGILNTLAEKKNLPVGHYLNGVHTVTPFLLDLADKRAYIFRQRYLQHFNQEPSWEAACYYDAMKLTAHAIERTALKASDSMLKKRKQLRKTLEEYNSSYHSVNGITARLYFNQDGCIERPYTIGQYVNGRFSPAYLQYRKDDTPDKHVLEKVLKGKAIWVNNALMRMKRIVYCGIKVNAIKKIDFTNGVFTADFYLWFRFTRGFDDKDIVFPDAGDPIALGEPIWELTSDGVTTRVFQIRATFKNRFDVFSFPFERHDLNIHFHHRSMGFNDLVYMKDSWGEPEASGDAAMEPGLDVGSNWRVEAIGSSHDIITHVSTLGIPDNAINPAIISYSRFNTHIGIARKNPFFPLVHVLPLFLAMGLVGVVDYAWARSPGRGFILLTLALTTALMNQVWLGNRVWVNYVTLVDYLFFGFHGLVFVAGVVQIQKIRLLQKDHRAQAMVLSRLFNIGYPLMVIIGFAWTAYYIRTLV
ncbi:MAG: ABC transporter substrate-binding protein [Desulfobacterium sp.]|nr:ABC transporter substrate-binding protein [Desulfobacterium sp.]